MHSPRRQVDTAPPAESPACHNEEENPYSVMTHSRGYSLF